MYLHKQREIKLLVFTVLQESIITVNEDKKAAKEIAHAQWRPHMNPVRNINTSTQ